MLMKSRDDFEEDMRRNGLKTARNEDGTYLAESVEAAWQVLVAKTPKKAKTEEVNTNGA